MALRRALLARHRSSKQTGLLSALTSNNLSKYHSLSPKSSNNKFFFLDFVETRGFATSTPRATMLLKDKAFVNGEWVSSCTNKHIEVLNPSNGSLVGTVPDMNVNEVENAICDAAHAFNTFRFTSAKERSDMLKKWYYLLVKHKDEISKILTLESGKPYIESQAELNYGNSFVEWFAEEARRSKGDIIASPVTTKKIFVEKEPIGVIGLITPWNFPHAMITRKAATAIAAGCTCVIKPSEDTPLTALAIAELTKEAGFPNGVFNVVTSGRENAPAIGKLFCESPLISGVSFTGSTTVGKILYQQSAGTIKRLALELGGNAPFVVFNSAKIDNAVGGAMCAKFRNAGQTCVGANRFLVQEDVHDEFVEKLCAQIADLKMGDGLQPGVTLGPLINKAQFDRVVNLVNGCKANNSCKVLMGGKPAESFGPLFYEPTVIVGVTPEMEIFQQEIFGPVVSVTKFSTEEEAIALANDTRSGLAGYAYTEDMAQMHRLIKCMEVGMLGINEGLVSTAEAPFGGVKESGIGREGSHYGMHEFEVIKYICIGNL